MTKFAHVKNGVVYRIIDLTDDEVADIPPHKTTYILPYIAVARPAFDPVTHHAPVRLSDVIGQTEVTQAWADPVAKTAEELDGEKERTLDRYDRLSFLVNFDQESRLRVLEARPAITPTQYRNALKARL